MSTTEFSDTTIEEVTVGAAQAVAEIASDPVGAARRQARSFERKGTPAVRRINRRLNAMLPQKVKFLGVDVNQRLPENLVIKGLHMVKLQARRPDIVGDAAKRTLRMFNGSFKTIARTASKFEQASDLSPRTQTERKPVRARRSRRTARRRAA